MNLFPPRILTLLIPLAILGVATAQASTESRLLRALQNLPEGAAPTKRVFRLAASLTKLDPRCAEKFVRIGERRLSTAGGLNVGNRIRLILKVAKVVKKSGLPIEDKDRIIKRLTSENEDGNVPSLPPDPTPSPTPEE